MRSVERNELNPDLFIEAKINEIQEIIKHKKALVALSGGVDSSTCAVLAHQAIGDQLSMVFIDDGLMREGEAEKVQKTFTNLGMNVEVAEAEEIFFSALARKIDPEEKRKAFRDVFYQTLAQIIKKREINFLIQGTIKADINETKRGIKTQHNVLEQIGIEPQEYGFRLIEPLKDIYKDEVREVAKSLGLPKEISERMPFPGPGLAIRVLGEVTPERVAMVRKATSLVENELAVLKPFQTFAVLLLDRSTGIKQGERTFGNIIVIRSVESKDALTASATEIPWNYLNHLQRKIIEEIPEVNRVLFDLTPKPPATIEYI